jgi:hypothetical protein
MTDYPRDDAGNIQVDFVWGNFPLQPDEDRPSGKKLNAALDNHIIATTGYSNYPSFIPNYAGDEDVDLEVVLPELLRLSRSAAEDVLEAVGLTLDVEYVTYDVANVSSAGKVVTITTDGDNQLAVGDVVSVTYNDGDGFSGTFANVKITKVVDSENFEFKVGTAPEPAYDFASTGYIYNNAGIVLAVDGTAGDIVNVGSEIPALVLNGD